MDHCARPIAVLGCCARRRRFSIGVVLLLKEGWRLEEDLLEGGVESEGAGEEHETGWGGVACNVRLSIKRRNAVRYVGRTQPKTYETCTDLVWEENFCHCTFNADRSFHRDRYILFTCRRQVDHHRDRISHCPSWAYHPLSKRHASFRAWPADCVPHPQRGCSPSCPSKTQTYRASSGGA